MCKKFLSFVLIGLLLNSAFNSIANAKTNTEKEAKFATKVKTEIAKLGVGKDARIKVILRDKTNLKGYVSETNEAHFVVVNEKNGTAIPVAYSKVKQVEGKNNLTGDQILVGIGIAVIIGILIFALSGED